jgi:hypothetical protein
MTGAAQVDCMALYASDCGGKADLPCVLGSGGYEHGENPGTSSVRRTQVVNKGRDIKNVYHQIQEVGLKMKRN